MLIPNHPDDERLSALASHDDDAATDAELTSHVSSCARCADLVDELGALRTSLAELPDLQPSRPLRLLPPVADEMAAGPGSWIRRLFAPALTAGAALALVGLVGTAAPALDGMALSGGDAGADFEAAEATEREFAPDAADEPGDGAEAPAAESFGGEVMGAGDGEERTNQPTGDDEDTSVRTFSDEELPAERSPWPMVLFTGVAVMVAAALLRWILVPRAG